MTTKHWTASFLGVLILLPALAAAQAKSPLDEPLAKLDALVAGLKVSSVIGEPIRSGETYIVPLAKIHFSLGAGGAMMGYGGGMGGNALPVGILIVEGEKVRVELFPLEDPKPSFFQEMLPTLLKMLPQIMGGKSPSPPQPAATAATPAAKPAPVAANACLDEVKKLHEAKKYQEALAMADSLLAQDPNNAELHVWKGHAMGGLSQSGNPMDMMKYGMGCQQEYETALKLDPNNAGAHFGRGMVRLMAPPGFGGDLDGAIADFEFTCKKEPFPEACYYLGEAYKQKGLNDQAKQAYEKALKLDPKYAQAAQALAGLK